MHPVRAATSRVDAEKAKAASEADAFKKQLEEALADYKAEAMKPVAISKLNRRRKRRRGSGLESEHGGHQYDEEVESDDNRSTAHSCASVESSVGTWDEFLWMQMSKTHE